MNKEDEKKKFKKNFDIHFNRENLVFNSYLDSNYSIREVNTYAKSNLFKGKNWGWSNEKYLLDEFKNEMLKIDADKALKDIKEKIEEHKFDETLTRSIKKYIEQPLDNKYISLMIKELEEIKTCGAEFEIKKTKINNIKHNSVKVPHSQPIELYFNNGIKRRNFKIINYFNNFHMACFLYREKENIENHYINEKYEEAFKCTTSYNFDSFKDNQRNKRNQTDSNFKKYVLKMDIANFYNSIYTHAIVWSALDKNTARLEFKKKVKERSYSYNIFDRIDEFIRKSNQNESYGIPVGNGMSKTIAELFLIPIDSIIITELEEIKSDKIKFTRYVDDYEFYFNNEETNKQIIKVIQNIFNDHKLALNESKLEFHNNYLFKKYEPLTINHLKSILDRESKKIFTIEDIKDANDFFDIFPGKNEEQNIEKLVDDWKGKRPKEEIVKDLEENIRRINARTNKLVLPNKIYRVINKKKNEIIDKINDSDEITELVVKKYYNHKLYKKLILGDFNKYNFYYLNPSIKFLKKSIHDLINEIIFQYELKTIKFHEMQLNLKYVTYVIENFYLNNQAIFKEPEIKGILNSIIERIVYIYLEYNIIQDLHIQPEGIIAKSLYMSKNKFNNSKIISKCIQNIRENKNNQINICNVLGFLESFIEEKQINKLEIQQIDEIFFDNNKVGIKDMNGYSRLCLFSFYLKFKCDRIIFLLPKEEVSFENEEFLFWWNILGTEGIKYNNLKYKESPIDKFYSMLIKNKITCYNILRNIKEEEKPNRVKKINDILRSHNEKNKPNQK